MSTEIAPTVAGDDRTIDGVVDIDRWTALALATLLGERAGPGALDLIFVDVDEMAELNLAHMGHEGPTDVLSFPLDADGGPLGDPDIPVHLGDVVLCPAVAASQARDHGGTFEAEMALLVIHGVLHVLGHDHGEPEETARMQGLEQRYLAANGFTHPARS